MARRRESTEYRKRLRVKRADVLPDLCPYCGVVPGPERCHSRLALPNIGKLAHEVYFTQLGGPTWNELLPDEKAAWNAVAQAVMKDVRRYDHIHRVLDLKKKGKWGREGIYQ